MSTKQNRYIMYDMKQEDGIFLLAIMLACLFFVMFIFLIIGMEKRHLRKRKNKKKINDKNVRYFIINFTNSMVTYFDKSNLRNKVNIDLESFYSQFDYKDETIIRSWIERLKEDFARANHFCETKAKIHSRNIYLFTLLQATSFNETKNILHIESHFLPYFEKLNKRKSRRVKEIKYVEDVEEVYNQNLKNKTKGAMFVFRIFSIYDYDANYSKENMTYLYLQLQNLIAEDISISTKLIPISDHEILLIVPSLSNNEASLYSYARKLLSRFYKFLRISTLSENYSISVGAGKIAPEYDFKQLLKILKDCAIFGENIKESYKITVFTSENTIADLKKNVLPVEIQSVLTNRSFNYYFEPVIDLQTLGIQFYVADYVPYETSLTTFDEFLEYAYDLNVLDKITNIVFPTVISIFKRTNCYANAKIILPIHVSFTANVMKTLIGQEAISCFAYVENEVLEWKEENDSPLQVWKKAKENGFELCLKLTNAITTLTEDELRIFDYFIVSSEFCQNLSTTEKQKVKLNTFLSFISKFNKPVIALHLNSFSDIAMAKSYGIKLVSSSELCGLKNKADTLPEKAIHKLKMLK